MQLTIDSAEPLEDVLRAVGSLYNVSLTTVDAAGRPTATQPAQSARKRSAAKPPRQAKKTTTATRTGKAKDIRTWASENGFDVGARGALPAAARNAYSDAHQS